MAREDPPLRYKVSNTEIGLDISIKNIIKRLSFIIREISNLSVPEKTIEDWKTLCSSVSVIDERLDNITDPELRLEFTNKIISFLENDVICSFNDRNTEKAILDIKNLSLGLTEDQRKFFLSSMFRILKVTEEIKIETNPKKFVNLTRLEGQISARAFLPFLPEEFRKSSNYPKLVRVLTRLGRSVNSFDTFIDLPMDYYNKQTRVKPNYLNRFLFLSAILSDSAAVLKDAGFSKDLVKQLFWSIKNNSEDKFSK